MIPDSTILSAGVRPRISVASPMLNGREREYLLDCIDSGWISSAGEYVDRFESAFAEFCGVRHAISCCNGTAALHVALVAMGVGPGDEVIVPSMTFIATANAVTYCGATPVFVDSEALRWNMDPALVERSITARTKGIVAVHLYGQPADMDALQAISKRHQLFLIEDAAEAPGARVRGRQVGSIGDLGTFSFYGNKILSTGEGGMVTTDSDSLAASVRLYRGQGMDPARRYWFPVVGYNYRLTNMAAAVGLAQVEQASWHLDRRLEIANGYRELLAGETQLRWQQPTPGCEDVFWMFSLLLEDARTDRDDVMARLSADGIETRPLFIPLHLLPPYQHAAHARCFPVAEDLGRRGLSLPTWAGLTDADIQYVCDRLVHHTR